MAVASRWVRRLELTLWIVGLLLLGTALEATVRRWHYQAEQERALFAVPAPAPAQATPSIVAPSSAPESAATVEPTTTFGPPPPPVSSTPRETIAAAAAETEEKPRSVVRLPRVPRDAFGRIEIPRIGLKAIVRMGADERTLSRAVGLVPGAALPGQSGNVVLAGHRDTFFRPLRKIRVDDRIRLHVPPEVYEYRVDSVRVVSPEETSVLQSDGTDELTLVTCYPFRFIGPAPDRFIVSATRVDGPELNARVD